MWEEQGSCGIAVHRNSRNAPTGNEQRAELPSPHDSASTGAASSRGKPTARWRQRFKRWVLRLALLAVSGFAALLMAEFMLRWAGIGSDQFLRSDPFLGVRLIPSKTGLQQGRCYRAVVSTNSQGWRGPETPLVKPQGAYRVLVLGDSFMAGLQVNDDQDFSSVLQSELNQRGVSRRVEVLNFGVPSWGTDQQYLALREYGLRYQPDLVLLAFYAQNDVYDNSLELHATFGGPRKPFFDLQDGRLVELPWVDRTPAAILYARRMAAPFRLYPLVHNALLRIPIAHRAMYHTRVVDVEPRKSEEAMSPSSARGPWPRRWQHQLGVYASDYSQDWKKAWDITEGLLAKIQYETERANGEFLLMQIADPIAVMPSRLLSSVVAGSNAGAVDIDKPSRMLRRYARRNDVDYTSMIPGFRKRIADSETEFASLYLQCDGHWTTKGHRLAVALVAPRIAEKIQASPASAAPHSASQTFDR
jgi:hypothetical protein